MAGIFGKLMFRHLPTGIVAAVGAIVLSGCTTATEVIAEGDTEPAVLFGEPDGNEESSQPKLATYRCDGGREMTVENRRTSILIASGDDSLELPAAPEGQTSRYALSAYALLLEGPTAMWMAGEQAPLNCVRPA